MKTYQDVLDALVQIRRRSRPTVTQTTLGERLGVAQSTVSAWEQQENEMGFDQLVSYAGALDHDLLVDLRPRGAATLAEKLLELVDELKPDRFDLALRAARAAATAPRDAVEACVLTLEALSKRPT